MTDISERLAIKACSLATSLWRAEYQGKSGSQMSALSEFVFKLQEDIKEGAVTKDDSALALIVIQLVGFSNTHALERRDDLERRVKITRKSIDALAAPVPQKMLLNRMLDLAETKYLADGNKLSDTFQIEQAVVPEYLFEFYEAFLDLEMRRPTSQLSSSEAQK